MLNVSSILTSLEQIVVVQLTGLFEPFLAYREQQRAIELSSKHFIQASKSKSSGDWAAAAQVRAHDVQPGDFVWIEANARVKAARVASKETVAKSGLWAPYTASGTIVVDGVAASVHSEWYLDGVFDAIGRPDLLPQVYQASPVPPFACRFRRVV